VIAIITSIILWCADYDDLAVFVFIFLQLPYWNIVPLTKMCSFWQFTLRMLGSVFRQHLSGWRSTSWVAAVEIHLKLTYLIRSQIIIYQRRKVRLETETVSSELQLVFMSMSVACLYLSVLNCFCGYWSLFDFSCSLAVVSYFHFFIWFCPVIFYWTETRIRTKTR